jgi:hypothetical protein
MKLNRFLITLFAIIPVFTNAQTYQVSGRVTDFKTGEPIIGAAVFELNTVTTGTATNVEGWYKLVFEKRRIWLKAAYIGYADTVVELFLNGDTLVNFALRSNTEIAEVEIEDEEERWKPEDKGIGGLMKAIRAYPMYSFQELKSKDIRGVFPKKIESPGSFHDIYIPRGGGAIGQTLYIDGARVYAPVPILDIFPIMEDESIGKLNYYWGNFPARFGSQNGSLIDLTMKEGDFKRYYGKVYVDFLHAGISAEGPVLKDQSSFMISARKSYFNHPLKDVFLKDRIDSRSYSAEPVFFDLNFKYAHALNENNKLTYTFFVQRNTLKTEHSDSYLDSIDYSYNKNIKETITNTSMTLNYRHIFTSDLLFDASLIFSRYNLNQSISGDSMGLLNNKYSFINRYVEEIVSGNEDYGFKLNLLWNVDNNHHLMIGAGIYDKRFRPNDGILVLNDYQHSKHLDTAYRADVLNVQEYSIYAEDRFSLGERFTGNIGLHFKTFMNGGNGFYSIEPRLYGEYRLFKDLAIHASYNYYKQFVHTLSAYTFGLQSPVFLASDTVLLPVNTHRATGGAELHLPFDIFINADVFYERSSNVLEYKDGYGFFDAPGTRMMPGFNLEERVTSGKANTYGLRVVLHKQLNQFHFKAGHTVTNSDYMFDSINFSDTYQYAKVNRHDFNLRVSYEINEDFKVFVEWIYKSGNYITPRRQSYVPYDYRNGLFGTDTSAVTLLSPEGEVLHSVGYRNDYKMPAYHRLDLGAEYKTGNHSFGIRIYNLYNRRNVDYFDYKEGIFSRSSSLQVSKHTSVPFFPTLSYSYRFGDF